MHWLNIQKKISLVYVLWQGSTRSMAFLMLDKVQAPELIPAVIKSSIEPYALENGLDLDQTLLYYIKVTFIFLCVVHWAKHSSS